MAKKPQHKIPVSARAAIARINRKLRSDFEVLKTARSESVERNVGRYFILDVQHNYIAHVHQDLETLGRKLGVLQEWETVTE